MWFSSWPLLSNPDRSSWLVNPAHNMAFSTSASAVLSSHNATMSAGQCDGAVWLWSSVLHLFAVWQDRVTFTPVYWSWFACHGPSSNNYRLPMKKLYQIQAQCQVQCHPIPTNIFVAYIKTFTIKQRRLHRFSWLLDLRWVAAALRIKISEEAKKRNTKNDQPVTFALNQLINTVWLWQINRFRTKRLFFLYWA